MKIPSQQTKTGNTFIVSPQYVGILIILFIFYIFSGTTVRTMPVSVSNIAPSVSGWIKNIPPTLSAPVLATKYMLNSTVSEKIITNWIQEKNEKLCCSI